MNDDFSKDWRTDDEGEGAWIRIDFRYEIEMFRIDLMQLYSKFSSWKDITIDMGGNREMSFQLKERQGISNIDQTGKEWDFLFFQPVNASYINITFNSYYKKDANGMKRIRIFGKRRNLHISFTFFFFTLFISSFYTLVKGLIIKPGNCSGNDLSTYTDTAMQDCETLCANNTECTGFVYDLTGVCALKNAKCTTITEEAETYYFEWSDSKFRFTMRTGVCDSSDYVQNEPLTFDECLEYMIQRQHQDIQTMTYMPTTGICLIVNKMCPQTEIYNIPQISFNFIGSIFQFYL